MKKLIVLFSLLIAGSSFAQVKNATATFEVDGVCGMCKKRIETAAIKTKGVKSASWDVETHVLTVFFDGRKTGVEEIQKNIAVAGHDTKEIKATDEAYNSVTSCCKYRDEEVVKAHD